MKLLTISFILIILSIALLGISITGNAVSESCCFPPFCSEENLCDTSDTHSNSTSSLFGVSLALLAFSSSYIFYHYKKE